MVKLAVRNDLECTFCGKVLTTDKKFQNHSCKFKFRYLSLNEYYVKLAYFAFSEFYKISMKKINIPTRKDFIKSNHYVTFTKFGRYLVDNKILYPEQYILYLLKSGKTVREWYKISHYEDFLFKTIRTESYIQALERSLETMQHWAHDNDSDYIDFFRKIEPNLAVNYIQRGLLSPWILYNTKSGKELITDKFNQDHIAIIGKWIDPEFWKKKFLVNKEDREYIKSLLERENI